MALALGFSILMAVVVEGLFTFLFLRLIFATRKSYEIRDGLIGTFSGSGVGIVSLGLILGEKASELFGKGFGFYFFFFGHMKSLFKVMGLCKFLFIRCLLISFMFIQLGWEEYKMVQIYEYENQVYEIDGEKQVGTISLEAMGEDLKPEIILVELTPKNGLTQEISTEEFYEMFPEAWKLFIQDWTSDLFSAHEAYADAMRDR